MAASGWPYSTDPLPRGRGESLAWLPGYPAILFVVLLALVGCLLVSSCCLLAAAALKVRTYSYSTYVQRE